MTKKIQVVQRYHEKDERPEYKLVCSILMQAMTDGLRPAGDDRDRARKWILNDSGTFKYYCDLAELDHVIIRLAAIKSFKYADEKRAKKGKISGK